MWNDWNNKAMAGFDNTGWWWPMDTHSIFWLLFLVLLVFSAIALIRSLRHVMHPALRKIWEDAADGSGISVLEQRYAKGEIDRCEYMHRKHPVVPNRSWKISL